MKNKIINLVIIVCWIAVMIIEVIALKTFIAQFGNSIQTYGTVLLVVMSGLSIGYFIGGKVSDKYPNKGTFALFLYAGAVCIFIIPLMSEPTNSIYIESLLILLPSIMLGTSSPYSSRLKIKDVNNSGKTFGEVSFLSGIGSMIGLILGSFILTNYFSITEIYYLTSVIILITATLLTSDKNAKVLMLIGIVLFISIISNSFISQPEELINPNYTKSLYELHGLNESQHLELNNFYGTVAVRDIYPIRKLYINTQSMGAMNMKNRTEVLPNWEYIQCLMHPLKQDTDIKEVLMIGLGAGIIPVHIEERYPNVNMTVVEINDAVVYMANIYFGVKDTKNLKIIRDDGRSYLRTSDKKYDLIIIDAYHFNNILQIPVELLTEEFYELTQTHLTSDGQLTIMVNTGTRLSEPQDYQSIYKTIDSVYDYTLGIDCDFQIIIASNNAKDYSGSEYFGESYNVYNTSTAIILTDNFFSLKKREVNN